MKQMINILIITVLALVVIAAGVQICRPKDHGPYYQYWDYMKVTTIEQTKDGPSVRVEMNALMSAFHLYNSSQSGWDANNEIFTRSNHKPKL